MNAVALLGFYSCGGNRYVVRVVFSDESGTGNIKEEPCCVVVALLLNLDIEGGDRQSQWDAVYSECAPLWHALKARLRATEMKGAKLLKRLRRYQDQEVDAVLRGLVESLVKNRVPVFCQAIDREGFKSTSRIDLSLAFGRAASPDIPTDPFVMAFGLCAQQVDRYIHALIPKEKMIWISDHASRHQPNVKASVRWHQMQSLVHALFSENDDFYSHLIDTVYFGDSHESMALQWADVCCSLIVGHLMKNAIAEPYYKLLSPTIIAEPMVRYSVTITG